MTKDLWIKKGGLPNRREGLQIFSCARLPDGRFLFRPAKGSFRRYASESSLDTVS